MTIKEIVGRIKKAVEIINNRRREYIETLDFDESIDEDYERHFERLKTRSFSGMKYDSDYDTEFVTSNIYGKVNDNGKLRKKRKSELQTQMEDLESFIAQDAYTPEGLEKWEEGKGLHAYEMFKEHYGIKEKDFSLQDFAHFTQQMSKIKNDLQNYGYEDKSGNAAYINAYMKSSTNQRERFFDVIKESYDEVKKKYQTPTYKSILKEAKKRFKKI